MIYIIILAILGGCVLLQTIARKKSIFIFVLFAIVLSILSIIRYGSGSDYFPYLMYYDTSPISIVEAINNSASHMNIGYRVLMSTFKIIGFNYDYFLMLLTIGMMTVYTVIIFKYSKFKLLSLFVFYSVYYHIYINSALRQGITLCIFLIGYFYFLQRKQTKKYVILILFGALFHEAILIALVFPIIQYLSEKYFYNKAFNITLIIGTVLLFFIRADRILVNLGLILGIKIPYEATGSNLIAVVLRVILIAFIYWLYKNTKDDDISSFEKFQIYSYFIGVLIFIAISSVPIFSRFAEYFSILEIIILGNLIYKVRSKLTKLVAVAFCILLLSVICVKDLISFTAQGKYYSSNVMEYPLVTIFNKEDILKYREIEPRFLPKELKVLEEEQ